MSKKNRHRCVVYISIWLSSSCWYPLCWWHYCLQGSRSFGMGYPWLFFDFYCKIRMTW